MGGLTAAVVAQEMGARTLCLEKLPEPGGSLALSGGYLWTVHTMDEYLQLSPQGDPNLGRVVVEDFETSKDWLCEHGVDLTSVPCGMGPGRAFGGYRIRPDPVSGAVVPLVRAFVDAGGELKSESSCVALDMGEAGEVRGITYRDNTGEHRVDCSAVVLATGGFQGDRVLMGAFLGPWADWGYARSNAGSTGDGVRLAFGAGAAASKGMSSFYGHLFPAPPARPDPAAFRTLTQFYSEACILVDKSGRRFVDESRGDEICALRLIRQEEATGFIVFDERRHGHEVSDPYVPDGVLTDPLPGVRAVGGIVIKADSIVTLARRLAEAYGVPRRQLLATVADFNEAARKDDAGLLTVDRRVGLHTCEVPPFYAVPVRPGITFTEGGVHVNSDCQALDRSGVAIRGLFVAGVDVGAISVDGYVGGLAAGLVTGMRAGVNAAPDL
jgi:succinate dehydrogenase/fumarate reductase flavoprotein subunit